MNTLVQDFAEALRAIDSSGIAFKSFRPGVGPYGEPQVVRAAVAHLQELRPQHYGTARTKRIPDVLIPGKWALEFKIVRPFGDNGAEAEHWSQNLLHPYPGNVSALADALKLMNSGLTERKGLLVFAYEHARPVIDTAVLVHAFELVGREVLRIRLGPRHESIVDGLVHPVHQRVRVFGWELQEP